MERGGGEERERERGGNLLPPSRTPKQRKERERERERERKRLLRNWKKKKKSLSIKGLGMWKETLLLYVHEMSCISCIFLFFYWVSWGLYEGKRSLTFGSSIPLRRFRIERGGEGRKKFWVFRWEEEGRRKEEEGVKVSNLSGEEGGISPPKSRADEIHQFCKILTKTIFSTSVMSKFAF